MEQVYQLVAIGMDLESGLPREVFSKTVFRDDQIAQKQVDYFYEAIKNNPLNDQKPIGIRIVALRIWHADQDVEKLEGRNIKMLNVFSDEKLKQEEIEHDLIVDFYRIIED